MSILPNVVWGVSDNISSKNLKESNCVFFTFFQEVFQDTQEEVLKNLSKFVHSSCKILPSKSSKKQQHFYWKNNLLELFPLTRTNLFRQPCRTFVAIKIKMFCSKTENFHANNFCWKNSCPVKVHWDTINAEFRFFPRKWSKSDTFSQNFLRD